MQRFDSALELSLHFHMLVPDGGFVADGAVDERPRFVKLEEPSDEEVAELLAEVAKRVTKMLQAHGRMLEGDCEEEAEPQLLFAGRPTPRSSGRQDEDGVNRPRSCAVADRRPGRATLGDRSGSTGTVDAVTCGMIINRRRLFALGLLVSEICMATTICGVASAAKKGKFDYANQPKNAPFKRSWAVDESHFTTGRTIDQYAYELDLRPLSSLTRRDHILDLGAGTMKAALGLARQTWRTDDQIAPELRSLYRHLRKNTPHVTAVTAEKYSDQAALVGEHGVWGAVNRASVTGISGLTPRVGRYFEELRSDRLVKKHGKFSFVMDLHGVLRYSGHTDKVGQKLAEVMLPNAQLAWKGNTMEEAKLDGKSAGVDLASYLVSSGAFRRVAGSSNLARTDSPWITPEVPTASAP